MKKTKKKTKQNLEQIFSQSCNLFKRIVFEMA